MDRSEKKNPVVPNLTSLLSQRNIFESHLMDEYMVKFLDKFKYVFRSSKTLLTFKLPLVVYFYRRRRFKTEVYILGPTIGHIFSKLMETRNKKNFELYQNQKVRKLPLKFKKKKKRSKKKKKFVYEQPPKYLVQKPQNPFIFSSMDIFKSVLLKHFFFLDFLSLYTLKRNLAGVPSLSISLKNRLELKKKKINFRRKLRRDSEGRVVNL